MPRCRIGESRDEGPRHLHRYRGHWDAEPAGECRVRVVDRGWQPPILIVTEVVSNASTSVTNLIEHLAPELIAKYLPHRFDALGEPPAVVIEHYEARPGRQPGLRGQAAYDLVTFATWRPRRVRTADGQERLAFGEPHWRRLPPDEVRALLGAEADDLSPARDSRAWEAKPPCPACQGGGVVRSAECCAHPEDDREGVNCHRCGDTGFVLVACPACLGTGRATGD